MIWIITLFCLLAATAAGQEPDSGVDTSPTLKFQPGDEERLGQMFRERWQRRPLFANRDVVLDDIAVSDEDPRVVVGLVDDGRVFLTTNAGMDWREVLAPMGTSSAIQSSDEDDLLGVEARIDELMDATEARDVDELGEEYEGYSEEQLLEEMSREAEAVSYTHLTLPTIYSV